MRKSVKVLGCAAIVAGAILLYRWPYLVMDFAGSASYTEQDKREYNYYTPDLLKKIPKVSSHYKFNYANVSGQAFQVYAIEFYNIKDTSKIDNYLKSLGYVKKETCDVEANTHFKWSLSTNGYPKTFCYAASMPPSTLSLLLRRGPSLLRR